MAKALKSYEISLWRDIQTGASDFSEQRVAIIGSDSMSSLSRAQTPKFKKGINGSKELTFKMFSQYVDPITGEKVRNHFVDLINNESKIKLKYRNKWYDFIVKNIQQDSSSSTITYTATDLFIVELSKNGYGLTLDTSLMNNSGDLKELASAVLQDTDWQVDVPFNPLQYITEQTVELLDENGNTIYAFYSSCKDQPVRFQYITDLGEKNINNIYDKPIQTYCDMEGRAYTASIESTKYGLSYPAGFQFIGITENRANRLVYTHKSKFNPALNKIVYSYNEGQIEGYTITDYISPNIISNLVTNNSFKSTSGWTGAYMVENDTGFDNKGSDLNAKVEAVAVSGDETLIDAFKKGTFSGDTNYTPTLQVKLLSNKSVLVNSGFYDNRNLIKNLAPGQKFVLLYKENTDTPFKVDIGVATYSTQTGHYLPMDSVFLSFDSSECFTYPLSDLKYKNYKFIIGTVPDNYNITDEKTYKKLKTQIFLTGQEESQYSFEDFQIFSYVSTKTGFPLLPENSAVEAVAQTIYYYYSVKDNPQDVLATGYRATEQEYVYIAKSDTPKIEYSPMYVTNKVRSINIKNSNYFNAIQTICETFEVWADFVVDHSEEGKIISKKVIFKESIEKPNYVGFRYGTNLKSSKRTIDSKTFVSKLIVPDNSNEFAKNGFCSISRAGANTSGENYIYDFSYYYNFGMLDQYTMHDFLYRPRKNNEDELQGYYVQLASINNELTQLIERYSALAEPLMQADADKQAAEAGKEAALEKYQDLSDTFLKTVGYTHLEIFVQGNEVLSEQREEQIEASSTLQKYLMELSEYYSAWQKYTKEAETAAEQYNDYKSLNDNLLEQINSLTKRKEELNKKFYKTFYRFIQEGTWKSEDYTDDEKYYGDAVSTAANSSVPKVSYSFSTNDLSSLENYEFFEFDLADRTWVEDEELFGKSREEVVITEIIYALDEPEQDSVKIQNYRDQFSDLFQKMAATTQSVQFAEGKWNKAAEFTNDNPVKQAAFLQEALGDAEMKLQNAGEQSVVWDKNGITVTDMDSPNKQIRIAAGAIMLRDESGDGLGWKTGITSNGINAKLINAGQLNTANVSIMHGDEPHFRWDAFGISAYYFESNNSSGYLYGLDTKKGVRFDRFGLYGYNGIDGATWKPKDINEIKDYASFALTWEGLYLTLGQGNYSYGFDTELGKEILLNNTWHGASAKMGNVGKYMYNTWVDGYPSYNENLQGQPTFVKIFTIGDNEGNEKLVIYDDGTLVAKSVRFEDEVSWVPEASPARSIYGPIELMNYPAPRDWRYKDIPDEDPQGENLNKRWHKIKGKNDVLYCHTDTAGAIWDGPFLISGRSIKTTTIDYSVQEKEVEPSTITNWTPVFPTDLSVGQYIYTRYQDIYDDNNKSDFRYSVSCPGKEAIVCYIESSIGTLINKSLDDGIKFTLIARMYRENEEIDDGSKFNYTWYKNGTKMENKNSKEITVTVGESRNAEFYFEAKRKQN